MPYGATAGDVSSLRLNAVASLLAWRSLSVATVRCVDRRKFVNLRDLSSLTALHWVMASQRGDAHLDVERAQVADAQRDPRRFAELYEANFDKVYAYVAHRTTSRHDAEDVTSTVFQRALAKLPEFEWRGVPLIAWLVRIAANELIGGARDRTVPVGEPAGLNVDDGALFEQIERRAVLYRLVRALPEDQKRVIALRFIDQLSIKEIAAELERSEGAVKQLQFRALSSLRSQLGESDV